ncbi:class I SAM-dependent methyltransferase [Zooshikella marina]|uniref:class I SAM-dependent methyltransferase n=1 Tax=Zooshikella ganghwensis TaxID=202772 RepID=UPI001BB07464|nr:class I SAM-dependent methyltransferase [Zooshikella ganghwensis]MBU2705615.1 class I SAM-dependent methyltransferase [Zooshikella ganghwensis]
MHKYIKRDPGYIDIFNRIAPLYDKKYGKDCLTAQAKVFNWATHSYSSYPTKILDIGCGTGTLLQQFSTFWPESKIIGLDPAQAMIEQARKKLPQAKFITQKAETIPLASNSIDLAICTTSFGHWHSQISVLNEINRVLCPNGIFILAEHRPPNNFVKLFLYIIQRLPNLKTLEEIKTLLTESGLTITKEEITKDNFLVLKSKKQK